MALMFNLLISLQKKKIS